MSTILHTSDQIENPSDFARSSWQGFGGLYLHDKECSISIKGPFWLVEHFAMIPRLARAMSRELHDGSRTSARKRSRSPKSPIGIASDFDVRVLHLCMAGEMERYLCILRAATGFELSLCARCSTHLIPHTSDHVENL